MLNLILDPLWGVLILLYLLYRKANAIMANTARLIGAVEHLTSVTTSVIALLGSLATQVRDNVGDPDALNSLADTIDSQADALAQAVVANTPASTPAGNQGDTTAVNQAIGAGEVAGTSGLATGNANTASESPTDPPFSVPDATEAGDPVPESGVDGGESDPEPADDGKN